MSADMREAFKKVSGLTWKEGGAPEDMFAAAWQAALASQPEPDPDALTIAYMAGVSKGRDLAQQAAPDDVAKDASRYRWLRWQGCTFYTDDPLTVPGHTQKATKHHVCEWAMDDHIDAAMLAEAPGVEP